MLSYPIHYFMASFALEAAKLRKIFSFVFSFLKKGGFQQAFGRFLNCRETTSPMNPACGTKNYDPLAHPPGHSSEQ